MIRFGDVALALHRWMESNGIGQSDVRIVVSFPGPVRRNRADMVLTREFQEMLHPLSVGPLDTKQFDLHGIDFRFETRSEGSPRVVKR